MRILVIDDSEDERDVAEAMLLSAGYEEVETVGSAEAAFRRLGIGEPSGAPSDVDLIVMDIIMEGIDGIEACARIRNVPRYADVPVIMVTSLADIDSLANAFVAGATDYITKPIRRVELLARARSALKLKAELDRRQARERELVQHMSSWSDRQSGHLFDEATGLPIGEVAEGYLNAAAGFCAGETSVIALQVDRMPPLGPQRRERAHAILAEIAAVVRAISAPIGALAAAYRNGAIVLILPDCPSAEASDLAARLQHAVAAARIPDPEGVAGDHATVSISVATGRADRWARRVDLLAGAVSNVARIASAGGNRIACQPALA